MDETLARAWAAIARRPDLAEAFAEIAGPLETAFGVVGWRIDRLDRRRRRWETLATRGVAGAMPADAPTAIADERRPQSTSLFSMETRASNQRPGVEPQDNDTQTLAGWLSEPPDAPLLAVFHIRSGRTVAFHAAADDWLDLLRVATMNHQRLAELQALREAAEADRRALLQRKPRRNGTTPIIGEHSGLKTVFERVAVAARSDMSILLLGATGSGKEVVARAVHERSPRNAAPFIRVNCGAIPPDLIDSELFGHEKGSFTGAATMRRGWFERADGGTLFLDEVAELSTVAQVRLLRVLQEKRFTRVGGEREITVNVRVVAATHRDLEQRVGEERFREDLWYRLAVFPIRIPTLGQRPEDIAELAQHFIERAAARLGLPPVAPTPAQIRLLETYGWPGNVRELISVIERAVVLGDGSTLDFDAALGRGVPQETTPATEATPIPFAPTDRLNDVIAAHIRQVLRRTGGRIAGPQGAARILGLHPNTLRSRMARLGISSTDSPAHE